MFSKFIGCCFPTKNENLITKKDFITDNTDNNNNDDYEDIKNARNGFTGNNFTMSPNTRSNNTKSDKNNKLDYENNQKEILITNTNSYILTNIPNHKYINSLYSRNIILERLKLANETNDLDIFKGKINNILQCKTMNNNNISNVNNNNNTSAYNINTNNVSVSNNNNLLVEKTESVS